jgi:hypothetical protein
VDPQSLGLSLQEMTFVIEFSNKSASRSFQPAMISPFTKAINRQVESQFRKDPSGRLIFIPSGRKGKAYFVDSKSDEEKIRALVKMYRSDGALIYWVAYLSFSVWILSFNTGAHRWTTEGVIASSFFLFLLLALWMLWSVYKQMVPAFTSSLSEVGPDLRGQLSDVSPPPRRLRGLALVSLFAGIVLFAVAILFATRHSTGKVPCPPKSTVTVLLPGESQPWKFRYRWSDSDVSILQNDGPRRRWSVQKGSERTFSFLPLYFQREGLLRRVEIG